MESGLFKNKKEGIHTGESARGGVGGGCEEKKMRKMHAYVHESVEEFKNEKIKAEIQTKQDLTFGKETMDYMFSNIPSGSSHDIYKFSVLTVKSQ